MNRSGGPLWYEVVDIKMDWNLSAAPDSGYGTDMSVASGCPISQYGQNIG